MKILVLNYEFPPIGGGASPVAFDISKLLVDRGNDVMVVTMGYKGLAKDEVVDGIKIHRVPCLRKKANVCHPWEQLSYIISALIYLRKHLKNNKYDICHTHFIIPTGIIALYLKKKFKLEYVLTAHGSDVIGHNNNRFRLMYALVKKPWKCIVNNANVVTAPSMHLISKMKTICNNENYRLIHNGIFIKDYEILEKKQYILVMSRLQESKGIQTILQNFSKIKENGWKLKIAGDGPYKKVLEDYTRKLNIEERVEFLGWVEGKSYEQLKLLGEASIFVSASWFEAQPVSVIEAMASGCFILASNIPAHRQLLEESNIFNNNELADKLMLAMNRKLESVHYDIKKYDWNSIIGDYENVLLNKGDK